MTTLPTLEELVRPRVSSMLNLLYQAQLLKICSTDGLYIVDPPMLHGY